MNKRKNENMFIDGRLFFSWITINSEQLNDGSAKKFRSRRLACIFIGFGVAQLRIGDLLAYILYDYYIYLFTADQ